MALRPPREPVVPDERPPVELRKFCHLDESDNAQLEQLSSLDPRQLSEDELGLLDLYARFALYAADDLTLPEFCGAGFCTCDGPCHNERADLADEQREWLHRIRQALYHERRRRRDLKRATRRRTADAPPRARADARAPVVRVRAREQRVRRAGGRRLALSRLDDDADLAPARREEAA